MTTEFSTFDYTQACNSPEVKLRVELLSRRLDQLGAIPTERILEVGIGSGDVTCMLADRFDRVTCVDPSARNCDQVAQRLSPQKTAQVEFIQAPVEQVSLPAETYNQIILLGVLEHLVNPTEVLQQLRKCLASSGRMHIVVNLADSLHRRLGVAMGMIENTRELSPSDISLGHYRIYTRDELCDQIHEAHLQITREQPFYLKPLPTSMLAGLSMEIHRGLNRLGREHIALASYIYLEAMP